MIEKDMIYFLFKSIKLCSEPVDSCILYSSTDFDLAVDKLKEFVSIAIGNNNLDSEIDKITKTNCNSKRITISTDTQNITYEFEIFQTPAE